MNIFLDTIGCRLNQSEIETMARQFRAAGHEIVGSAPDAQLAVINTCAVTAQAASDSRAAIRNAGKAGIDEIVVTGCWSTLDARAAAALPRVRRVVPNVEKDYLVADALHIVRSEFDLEPLERAPLPGLRHRTRAFIKVQDGCDNRCTFCVTTIARGVARSRTVGEVLGDIHAALAGGTKEIVLTGVHLGSWGADFRMHVRDLVHAILRETDAPRVRLSSLEPWDLDADFFALWQDPRLMPHLHLPLQSGCESTLKRMARKTSPQSFRELVRAARDVQPEIAITTDIIAGFPGETESEFAQTVQFVHEMKFAGGHVFSYSERAGTGAAMMKGQIRPGLRKIRSHMLHDVLAESASEYRRTFVGREMKVLWESVSEYDDAGWQVQGWSGNYLRVQARASSPRWNELDDVRLLASDDNIMLAAIL